jgi:ribosome-associated heat shock protein Hsp15
VTNDETIRLDKWLWHARFYKTRTLATKICQAGRVRVNGQRTKSAHHAISPGDVLTFTKGTAVFVVRVLMISDRRGPAKEAQLLYETIGD